jgi:hypothetical protein
MWCVGHLITKTSRNVPMAHFPFRRSTTQWPKGQLIESTHQDEIGHGVSWDSSTIRRNDVNRRYLLGNEHSRGHRSDTTRSNSHLTYPNNIYVTRPPLSWSIEGRLSKDTCNEKTQVANTCNFIEHFTSSTLLVKGLGTDLSLDQLCNLTLLQI